MEQELISTSDAVNHVQSDKLTVEKQVIDLTEQLTTCEKAREQLKQALSKSTAELKSEVEAHLKAIKDLQI